MSEYFLLLFIGDQEHTRGFSTLKGRYRSWNESASTYTASVPPSDNMPRDATHDCLQRVFCFAFGAGLLLALCRAGDAFCFGRHGRLWWKWRWRNWARRLAMTRTGGLSSDGGESKCGKIYSPALTELGGARGMEGYGGLGYPGPCP